MLSKRAASDPLDSEPDSGRRASKRRRVSVLNDENDSLSQNRNDDDEPRSLTQPVTAPKRNKKKGEKFDTCAESGILKMIKCENFMCHKKLVVDLGPHVNFIHGQNGSGKSAVLVGLQTCLGCRAQSTNRGSSIKQLIKDGEERARVCVTIKNEGTNAWKPLLYGDEITVEREFTITGQNSYKIKSADGKIVSRKRDELNMILQHFTIYITNPCVIMNQDTSREYLQSKKAGDKYRFFLEATQLHEFYETLNDTKQKAEDTDKAIEDHRVGIAKLKKEVAKKRQQVEDCERMGQLERDIQYERRKFFWSTVQQKDAEIEKLAYEASKKEAKLNKVVAKIQKKETEIQTIETDSKELQVQQEQETEKNKAFDEKINEAGRAVTGVKKELGKVKRTIKQQKKQLDTFNRSVKEGEGEIEKIRLENSRDLAHEERLLQEELMKLQQSFNERDGERKGLLEEKQQVDEKDDEMKEKRREVKECVNRADRALHQAKQDIVRLSEMKNNDLRRFCHYAPEIEAEVQRNRRKFKVMPMGPLGTFLKVDNANQEWLTAIECCMNVFMSAYLVDNPQDLSVLKNILNRVYQTQNRRQRGNGQRGQRGRTQKQPVLLMQRKSDRRYQLRANRSRDLQQMHTILDLITINDPWVSNILIDKTKCEKWYVHPSSRESMDLVERFKHEVKGFIDKNGTKVEMRGRSISTKPWRFPSVLSVDFEDSIRRAKEQQVELARELDHHRQQQREVEMVYKRNVKTLAVVRRKLNKLEQTLNSFREEIDEKKADIAYNEGQRGNRVDDSKQREWLQEILAKREAHLQVMEELKSTLQPVEEQMRAAEENHRQAVEEGRAANGQNEELNDQITALFETKMNVESGLKKYRRMHNEVEDELADLGRRTAQEEGVKETLLIKGKEMGEKIANIRESPQVLQRKIQRLEARLKADQSVHGNLHTIKSEFMDIERKYNQQSIQIERLTQNRDELIIAIQDRATQYENFIKVVVRSCKRAFKFYLSQQGHSGKLDFNHEDKTLGLSVTANAASTNNNHSTKDTKSLSGGERSFATLAFVLALGESMDMPFRAMDEFDVFMDSVNRRISMEKLIDSSLAKPEKQFIFISPLDISMLNASDPRIKVLKMHPPQRGQTQLSFSRTQ